MGGSVRTMLCLSLLEEYKGGADVKAASSNIVMTSFKSVVRVRGWIPCA